MIPRSCSALALASLAGCTFDDSGIGPEEGNAEPGEDAAGAAPDAGRVDGGGGGWDADYDHRLEVAVEDPDLEGPLEDVPVLLVLDPDRIDYADLRADGGDLRAVGEDDEELAAEVEHWDASGSSYVWVRLPRLEPGEGARFWLYYGDADAEADDRRADVWSDDYLAVWHLAEDVEPGADDGIHEDSTGRGHDGAQGGNAPVGPEVGAIGGAQRFDGGEHIEVDTADLDPEGDALTLLARAHPFPPGITFPHVLGAGEDGRYWQLWFHRDFQGWRGRVRADGDPVAIRSDVGAPNAWHVVVLVYDGQDVRLYVDGDLVETPEPLSGDVEALDTPLLIGDNPELSPRGFSGYIDEVRIARAARSADWIRVQHLSMSDQLLTLDP